MRAGLPIVVAMIGGMAVSAGTVAAQTSPLLQLQGQPYSGGDMTLHLTADVGVPAYVLYGLGPLDPPLQLSKGPFYIGMLANAVLVGVIPAPGKLDFAFALPLLPPAASGIPLVLQGFVPGALSNPATIPLDQPHLEPAEAAVLVSPYPMQQAQFGDTVAVGDLDDDGHQDIVAGAWFEDFGGIDKAGRVYVFWGPDYLTMAPLPPSEPKPFGVFGITLTIADLDGDGVDDLIAPETSGVVSGQPGPFFGLLHVYLGGTDFWPLPSFSIPSAETGFLFTLFGSAITTGDFDDDGDVDVAVGVKKATVAGFTQAGRIDVYLGPDFGTRLEVTSPEPAQDDNFGVHLATGDFDGDGIDDLAEASAGDDVGGVINIGSAHLFRGPALTHYKTIANPLPDGPLTDFGWALHADDLDGDGLDEAVISDQRNRVFVFWSPGYEDYSLLPKPALPGQSLGGETSFGHELTTADVNGDGLIDLLVSDPFEGQQQGCAPQSDGGALFVALAPYFATFHRIVDVMPSCGSEFCWSVAVAEVDGDPGIELVVGSPTADDGGIVNSGHVTLFDIGGN